jgi:hypothetical protein
MKTGVIMLLGFLTATPAGAELLPDIISSPVVAPSFSKDIFAAARHAARDRNVRVLNIRSAEVDLASNYSLCLAVRGDDKRFQTRATVSRNSAGHYSLTRWFPGGC